MKKRTLSEREREWVGTGNDPEWPTLMARAKSREIWIFSMAVGHTNAEWVLRYVDYAVPTMEQEPLMPLPGVSDEAW